MGMFTRLTAAFVLAFALLATVLAAQTDIIADIERWDRVASRAETLIDQDRGTDATFEALRGQVAEFRSIFDQARGANGARIATLREQLAALGPAPSDDGAPPEAADVAAQRQALTDQLSALLVPVQRAEAEFVRAGSLVNQIDQILRDRQTRQLLTVSPTPLNPVYWQPALTDLTQSLRALWIERPGTRETHTWQSLRQTGPVVFLLSVLGLVLIGRGRRWSTMIVASLQRLGARGFGIWRFVVSLLRIILPFAGTLCLAFAVISTKLFGDKGNEIIIVLAFVVGFMLALRWVSERVFSRDDDEALILLAAERRKELRFHVSLITVMLVITVLISEVLEAGVPAGASEAVLVFLPYLVASVALYRIGVLLRSYSDPSATSDVATPELRVSTVSRLVRGLGTGAIVVGCVAPILLAAGYFRAADALLPPYIMTLAVLGLVMVLQRFAADVYGAVTGQGDQAREALLPVLFGLVLLICAVPPLALIWGARVTDLTEMYAAFGRGFAIGDSRISPTDFLAFAVIFVVGYALTRLVQSALRGNVLPKTRIDVGGQNAIVSGIGYVGIFLAALAAITGAGIDLSSLAIVAGALSVGIGFGLQNIVSNFVSGIILLIERPISEGDWIEVGGQMGYVRDISVRSTRIETFDRTDVIVPNADLVSGTVTNYTRGNTLGRLIVPVGVAYGTDTTRIDAILREIAEAQPMVLASPPPSILFLNFGGDALEFEIRCFLRDVNWMLVVKNDINHAIAKRFAEEGIEIPFAQRDLWLRNPEVLRTDGRRPEVQATETQTTDTETPEDRTGENRTPDIEGPDTGTPV